MVVENMKTLFLKIDKIGLMLFVLILFHWMFEIYQFSLFEYSVEQTIHPRFYIFPFCGLLLIFRSSWSKFAALSLSLSVLFSVYGVLVFGRSGFFTFVHFFYSQGMSFSEIAPLILLIVATIYSFYLITVNLLIERRKNITFK